MKKPTKIILKLFSLAFVFMLGSCEKDLYENTISKSKIKVEKISLKEVSSKSSTNTKLLEAVNKVRKNSSNSSKIIYDGINNIYFDDEKGIKISKDEYESYTFKILNESNKLENLLFTKNSLQEYDIYKVKYDFTEEELKTLSPEIIKQRQVAYLNISSGKMEVPELICVEWEELVDTGELVGADSHSVYQWVNVGSKCFWQATAGGGGYEGSGSVGTNASNNGDTGGEINGGGTGIGNTSYGENSSETQIITSPIHGGIADIQQSYQDLIKLISLTPAQSSYLQLPAQHNLVIAIIAMIQNDQNEGVDDDGMVNWIINQAISQGSNAVLPTINFFNNNYDTYISINDYLIQNNFNSESVSFMTQCITQMIQNPNVFTSLNPFIIEKQIDDTDLNPCSKAVLSAIKNSQNNDIATIIAKLGNSKSRYNTKITKPNLGSVYGTLGATNWTGFINGTAFTPYNYTVQINLNLISQGTTLQIYATMLHELIHAYFLSLIDDCHQANNCTLLQSYPQLWNYYVECQDYGILTNSISQHNQIAINYVNIIATALEEFQPGLDQQLYQDLAWGGLEGTTPYENNDPLTRILTPEDRARIVLVNQAEASNQSQTQSTNSGVFVATYTPKGQPCN